MVLFSRIGGLLFIIIIARYLMPERFGIYNLALSISLILLQFMDSGINQSLMRYVSEALGEENKKLAAANSRYLLRIKMVMALVFSILLMALAYPLSAYVFNKPQLFLPLLFIGFYILSSAYASFYSSHFYIIERVRYLTNKQFLFEIIRITAVLVLFTVVAQEYYVVGTFLILSLALVLSTIYLTYNLRKLSPYLFEKSSETVDKKRIMKFFIYMGVMGSLLVVFGYIDTIIIGILLESAYVGFYGAALALTGGIWSFLNIAYVLLPVFTQMKDHDLETSINRVFKYISILAIPIIFGIFILGKYLIRAIYGYEYLPAVLPFYILSLMILIVPINSTLVSLFSAKEKPRYVINIIIVSIILNIILDIILINYLSGISLAMGITGAAIATIICELFYLFGLLKYTRKELKIKLKSMHLMRPIISGFIMFLVLYFITLKIPEINLFSGAMIVILGAAIYVTMMFLIKGLKDEDIKLVKHLLSKQH